MLHLIDVLNWVEDILGQPGPIILDSRVKSHIAWDLPEYDDDENTTSRDFTLKEDLIKIGKKGKNVSLEDIRKALLKIEIKPELRTGYMYHFEGIGKSQECNLVPSEYEIYWGS